MWVGVVYSSIQIVRSFKFKMKTDTNSAAPAVSKWKDLGSENVIFLFKKGLQLQPVHSTSSSIPVSFLHLAVNEVRGVTECPCFCTELTRHNIHMRPERGADHSEISWPLTHPAYLISRLWKTISRQLLSIRGTWEESQNIGIMF